MTVVGSSSDGERPNSDLNAKTRRRRRIQIKKRFLAHDLGFLRYLRAFAFKAFGFLFEPAQDGNADAAVCSRDILGCRGIGSSSSCRERILSIFPGCLTPAPSTRSGRANKPIKSRGRLDGVGKERDRTGAKTLRKLWPRSVVARAWR